MLGPRPATLWFVLALGCDASPAPQAPTASQAAPIAPSTSPPLAQAVTIERVAAGLGYRGTLTVRDGAAPTDDSELVAGRGLWTREIAADGAVLVSVFACEGSCTTPMFDRIREAVPHQFPVREAALGDGRSVTVAGFSAMMGGWGATARMRSPSGLHEVVVMVMCADGDTPVPDEARAMCRDGDARDLAEAVARALDPAVFVR